MKNSFFNRFVPKQPKFFSLLEQLSNVLAEAADILTNAEISPAPAAVGCAVTAAGIAAAFFKYCRKDIY